MTRFWAILAVLILAVATALQQPAEAAGPVPATSRVSIQPAANAIAIIFSRTFEGTSTGTGFFVGDGSVVVTSRHVVFPTRLDGRHRGEAMVTVLSPYLGTPAEAHVMAVEEDVDLLLLRVPWKGHPSLGLASESAVLAAGYVDVVGCAEAQSFLAAGTSQLLRPNELVAAAAQLRVNGILVRQSVTQSIVTASPPPGPGWAGSPVLVAGTSEIAGCYSRSQANGSAGASVAVGRIRSLLAQAGAAPTRAGIAVLAAPAHSAEASLAYMRGASASLGDDPKASLEHFNRCIELRPTSAVCYRDAAGQLRALRREDEAQEAYAKALQLEPMNLAARVLYGQLLHDRVYPKSAEEHLRFAWEQGSGGNAAVIPLCNLLRELGRDAECVELLEMALDRNPLDGHVWAYVGRSRQAMNDRAAAATAFARAAELMPERELLRAQSAEQFEAAGQPARAEEQYRALIGRHPDSAAAHYRYARFLAGDAARREDAMRLATRALELSDESGSPPKGTIQALIAAIRDHRATRADGFHL